MDTFANALIALKNSEIRCKRSCEIKASKLIGSVLKIMQREGYIEKFAFIDDGKSGIFAVNLIGKINNCRAIKPRFSVGYKELIVWEKRFLPARNIGFLVLSTSDGLLTNAEAKQKKVGGKLLAFVY
jgi:small subunit ribosomal protein S8